MSLDQIVTPVRQILGIAGVVCAVVAVAKLTGLASLRGGVIEWAAVAIACATAGR